ncbi:hypothetical protein ONS96_003105 [Cadophora gregata f. sp. sojae]|nr:hypothetical protein ONS96_003105 [Cadophora gregata f. sp. sojae]
MARIRFRLSSGYTNPNSGLVVKKIWHAGLTEIETSSYFIRVNVSVEMLQPFLNLTLTSSERTGSQFKIAANLVHELALHKRETTPELADLAAEPYVEDEVLSELGWSLEDKLWNGEPFELLPPEYSIGGPGLAHAGFTKPNVDVIHEFSGRGLRLFTRGLTCQRQWFTDKHQNYSDAPALDNAHYISEHDDPYYQFTYDPVPTTWLKLLCSSSLWNVHVHQFGLDTTRMWPCYIGTVTQHAPGDTSHSCIKLIRIRQDLNSMIISRSMSQAEISARETENCRQAKASSILSRMSSLIKPDTPGPGPPDTPNVPSRRAYTCSRYQEITKYLFENQAPGEWLSTPWPSNA